jgi:hypothetical protein
MAEHWRRSALTKQPTGELKEGRQYVSRQAIVLEACINIADTDSEDDKAWHAAWVRFWTTFRRLGWTPPEGWSETRWVDAAILDPLKDQTVPFSDKDHATGRCQARRGKTQRVKEPIDS